ncbi:MAG: hypothetical protein WCP45_05175 [Verrucomicrobiota bacterium]
MKSSFLPTALLVCAINAQTITSGTGVPVSSTQVAASNESGDTSSSRSVAGTTPFSPPSGPVTGSFNGPHIKCKFPAKNHESYEIHTPAPIVPASAVTLNAAGFFFKDGDKVAMMGNSTTEQ